jgi:competence protein ComEC
MLTKPQINWREAPMVRLLIPLIVGISVAAAFPNPIYLPPAWLLSALVLLLFYEKRIPWPRRWIFGLLLNLTIAGFGVLIGTAADQRKSPDHFAQQITDHNIVIGEISRLQLRGNKMRAFIKVKRIGTDTAHLFPARGQLMVYLSDTNGYHAISSGDELILKGKIIPTTPALNPKAFDYARYLHYKNIHYQCFVYTGQWTSIPRKGAFAYLPEQARRYGIQVLRHYLPNPQEFGVATALILGYRDETPEEITQAYSATGATHVLAVSGLHVGIVQVVLSFLLRFLKSNNALRIALTISGVWAFTLITGGAGSTMRAATMFSFMTIGKGLNRYANTYNTLAASAFVLLCYQPGLLHDMGFQLSYLAVVGIVYFHPKIHRSLHFNHKIAAYIWELTALSIAATLTTIPISMFYFHQFPVWFWLSSLIAVPMAGLILSTGLLLFALHFAWPALASWVGYALSVMTWLMNQGVLLIEQIPNSLITGIWISPATTLLMYLVLLSIAMAITLRSARWLLTAGILCLSILVHKAVGDWQQLRRREIVIYHARRESILDIIDARAVYTLASAGGSPFIQQNYHGFCQVAPFGEWCFEDEIPLHKHWYFRYGILHVFGTRLAIVQPQQDNKDTPAYTDYLLIRGNPRGTLRALTQGWTIGSGTIILDGSNHPRNISRWRAEAAALGLRCHDTGTQGAWIAKIYPPQ